MTNTAQRLILFFVALPLLAAIIFFLPMLGHIGVIAILTAVGLLCGIELKAMLASTAPGLPAWSVILPALAPLLSWGINMDWIPGWWAPVLLTAAVAWSLAGAVLADPEELRHGFSRMGSRLLLVMYPAFLLWWVARLTWYDRTTEYLLVFMFSVFLNDSAAWLFGVLFGKHRGIFAVSPNKSLEGYLGGLLGSIVVMVASRFLLPGLLPDRIWQLVLCGLMMGTAVSAGDLVESALKRSLSVKDSGNIILGRGGMLDSVDSIIFSAPVFIAIIELAA